MWSVAVVIPLLLMALPVALILLAVLVDVLVLGWFGFRMWHDEWAVRVGDLVTSHLIAPLRRAIHHAPPIPRPR